MVVSNRIAPYLDGGVAQRYFLGMESLPPKPLPRIVNLRETYEHYLAPKHSEGRGRFAVMPCENGKNSWQSARVVIRGARVVYLL